MSKSPLSGAFADSSATAKKKSKKNGAILLIAGIALTSSIGGVFAATTSITVNGGSSIEFGQGLAEVDTCAATAETTVNQEYDATDEEFYVTTVDVVFAPAAAGDCNEKNATISLVSGTTVRTTKSNEVGATTQDAVRFDFTGEDWEAGFVTDVTVVTKD